MLSHLLQNCAGQTPFALSSLVLLDPSCTAVPSMMRKEKLQLRVRNNKSFGRFIP